MFFFICHFFGDFIKALHNHKRCCFKSILLHVRIHEEEEKSNEFLPYCQHCNISTINVYIFY